jgi:hypothetical protein
MSIEGHLQKYWKVLVFFFFFSVRSCLEELFSKEYYSSKVLWAFLRATTVRCQLGLLA